MSAVPEIISPAQELESLECGARNALHTLRNFIGKAQIHCLLEGFKGEEQKFFFEKALELEKRVKFMPKVYEQDGLGEQAIVYLHYFVGSCDWLITERDTTREQLQAFGWADLGDPQCAELGYISIQEIIQCGAELDFYYEPRTLEEAKKGLRR